MGGNGSGGSFSAILGLERAVSPSVGRLRIDNFRFPAWRSSSKSENEDSKQYEKTEEYSNGGLFCRSIYLGKKSVDKVHVIHPNLS